MMYLFRHKTPGIFGWELDQSTFIPRKISGRKGNRLFEKEGTSLRWIERVGFHKDSNGPT